MKYLTSAENTATWAEKTSYMPVRESAYKTLQSGFYSQNPSQAVGAGMLSKGELIVLPSVPTSNEQRDALTTEINNIAALRKDPKTGLNDAASKMNDILTTG
jgi:ABC-type glycerol-3-phosphate transport system substrate-binding protein